MTLRKAHRVVVLGAGYAGLPAAKRLARREFPDEVEVTLVSAGPDFVERPRLHAIADEGGRVVVCGGGLAGIETAGGLTTDNGPVAADGCGWAGGFSVPISPGPAGLP